MIRYFILGLIVIYFTIYAENAFGQDEQTAALTD
jgi:hypothetical protein